jgi:hypothetical protein
MLTEISHTAEGRSSERKADSLSPTPNTWRFHRRNAVRRDPPLRGPSRCTARFMHTLPVDCLEAVVQCAIFAGRFDALALSDASVGMKIERIRCPLEVHCRLADHLVAPVRKPRRICRFYICRRGLPPRRSAERSYWSASHDSDKSRSRNEPTR